MLDARDAMVAADQIRFGGANQDLLWNTFASRGFGQDAASAGAERRRSGAELRVADRDRGDVHFEPVSDGGAVAGARLFVGRYEARTTPVADTDPATPLDASLELVAGHLRVARPGARLWGEARLGRVEARAWSSTSRSKMLANLAVGGDRCDRDRRRHQPRQADRRHRGDQLGLARVAGRGQAGHGPARPEQAVAPGRAGPGERELRPGFRTTRAGIPRPRAASRRCASSRS